MRQEAKAMKETAEQLEEEKQRLNEEVQFLRGRMAVLERQASAAGGESKQRDAADSNSGSAARIRALEVELREAREESERRVSDTVQFQQMKKLMQSQSQNIADLRRRLARWEPDDAKGE
jgi:predicted  nucleic acid-binding Zn-ribbon protein